MHPMLHTAVRAARAAGRVMLANIDRLDRLQIKDKGKNELVSQVDRQAEKAIVDMLRNTYPDHSIKAEECGAIAGNPAYQWIIDPLDGSGNFLRGIPQFCVSIALKAHGRIAVGVIYDPIKEELFTTSRGNGAYLNDRRIRVTARRALDGAALATEFPSHRHCVNQPYLQLFMDLLRATGDVRRQGCAALDLAYVACGRLDGYWSSALADWDMAAGALLMQEAGGLVGDFNGGHQHLETGDIVAATPKLFPAILKIIRPHLASLPTGRQAAATSGGAATPRRAALTG